MIKLTNLIVLIIFIPGCVALDENDLAIQKAYYESAGQVKPEPTLTINCPTGCTFSYNDPRKSSGIERPKTAAELNAKTIQTVVPGVVKLGGIIATGFAAASIVEDIVKNSGSHNVHTSTSSNQVATGESTNNLDRSSHTSGDVVNTSTDSHDVITDTVDTNETSTVTTTSTTDSNDNNSDSSDNSNNSDNSNHSDNSNNSDNSNHSDNSNSSDNSSNLPEPNI